MKLKGKAITLFLLVGVAVGGYYTYSHGLYKKIGVADIIENKELKIVNPEEDYYNEMLERALQSSEYKAFKTSAEAQLKEDLLDKQHTMAWEYMNNYTIKVMSTYSENKVRDSLHPDSCLRAENKNTPECKEALSNKVTY